MIDSLSALIIKALLLLTKREVFDDRKSYLFL